MPRKATAETPALDFTKSLQKLSPDSFFRFIREYPNQEGTSIYVYRLQPVIDRKLAGLKDSNIDIVAGGPVDEEYLLRAHGSGVYHLKFTDGNKPKSQTEVAKSTVEIWDPKVDPILNPVELVVGARGNDRWIQHYIGRGWQVQDNRLQPPAAEQSGSDVLARTVSDLAERVGARPVSSEADSEGWKAAIQVMREQLQAMQQPRPAGDSFDADLKKIVLTKLLDTPRPAEPARPDPITQLKETAGLLKEFGWGAQAGGGGSWVDALTALPGILQHGAEMMKQMVMLRAMQPGVVPIDSARPGAPPAAAPQSAGFPATNPQTGGDMFGLGFDVNALMAVGEDAIDAFNRGIDGDDFALSLCCRRGGEALYTKLYGLGKEGIMSAIGMAPGVAAQLAPRRAELETWIDAFLKFGEAEEPGKDSETAAA